MTDNIVALVEGTYSPASVHQISPYTNLKVKSQKSWLYVFESDLVSEIFSKVVGSPTMSLFKWSKMSIIGYNQNSYLPYPEYDAILYFVDSSYGYEIATKLDIGTPRRIFTYLPFGTKFEIVSTNSKLMYLNDASSLGKFIRGARMPILAISSSWYINLLVGNYTFDKSFQTLPPTISKEVNSVSDSLWILGIYRYRAILFTSTLEYAGIPYRNTVDIKQLKSQLGNIPSTIATYTPEYPYSLTYNRFDSIIQFLSSTSKLDIQREVVYSLRYPLPPQLSKLIWYWANMNKPVFPLLIFCMFAAFRRNIPFKDYRNNKYSKSTPALGLINMINRIVELSEGQINDPDIVYKFCLESDIDYESVYPVLYGTYLVCLANNLPVGGFKGGKFVEVLRELLESLNWESYLTRDMEIYFPTPHKLPLRGYPLVKYSYFV
jgi:hypothetical protein